MAQEWDDTALGCIGLLCQLGADLPIEFRDGAGDTLRAHSCPGKSLDAAIEYRTCVPLLA
jgi:hypothetical protein